MTIGAPNVESSREMRRESLDCGHSRARFIRVLTADRPRVLPYLIDEKLY